MFIRLKLKNWRSIDDATIELAPFTVLVGRNSSGKSNVVEALLFVSEIARDAVTAVDRRGGITSIRRFGPSKPFDVSVDVRVASTRERLDTDAMRHFLLIKSGKEGAWHFHHEEIEALVGGERAWAVHRRGSRVTMHAGQAEREFDVELPETTSAMLFARQAGRLMNARPALRTLLAARKLHPVPEVMRQPQAPAQIARLAENGGNITTAIRKLSPSELSRVVEAMRRIVPGLEKVTVEATSRHLALVFEQLQGRDRRAEFASTEMSDGALRALALMVAAQQMTRDEVLVIEEPEVSLHPGAADIVYDVLHQASVNGAVLLTTHSPELVDRARDDEILVCDYVDGVTRIGPLAEEQRAIVRDGLFSAAELMRSDELRIHGEAPRVVRD